VHTAKIDCGAQSLIGEGGRHADVDNGHIGTISLDRSSQSIWSADRVGDHKAPINQQLDQTVTQDGRVLSDDDAYCRGHLGMER
jgi:hypothetical protein